MYVYKMHKFLNKMMVCLEINAHQTSYQPNAMETLVRKRQQKLPPPSFKCKESSVQIVSFVSLENRDYFTSIAFRGE